MRIYELTVAEGQEWVLPKALEDNHLLSDLRGQYQFRWTPLAMEILTESDDGTSLGYSDFPWYGSHILILRNQAADALRHVMSPYGQFLSLEGPDRLQLFNATTVLDALDEDLSQIVRFDDGDILHIERYAFRQEAVGNSLIFKLPYRASNLCFQAPFVEQISTLRFSGIKFELVWSDEIEPVRYVTLQPRDRPKKGRWWRQIWPSLTSGRLLGRLCSRRVAPLGTFDG